MGLIMLRRILTKPEVWGIDRAEGSKVCVTEDIVAVYDKSYDEHDKFQGYETEPNAVIQYDTSAGVKAGRNAAEILSLILYTDGEMEIRTKYRGEKLYVNRTTYGDVLIRGGKKPPVGWDERPIGWTGEDD